MTTPDLIRSAFVALSRRVLPGSARVDPAAFKALFETFKSVLASNNRALETISDMGEKLGGDYLFDIVYVRKSYVQLKKDLDESLRLFDGLTRKRYPQLEKKYEEIDSLITRVIDETATAHSSLVVHYDKINRDMASIMGGKNRNLAEIRNALNLRVPDAFAITTTAFDLFMQHKRIFEKVPATAGPAPEWYLQELREEILHGSMPPDVSRELERAIKKIKANTPSGSTLAVRSSAGEEDGVFSFAGQFESVLNVPLEIKAVEKAYRTVLASLYSDKAVAYQKQLGYELRDMKMAAACVTMVDAAASGVAYSTDPKTNGDSLIINSVWGLGVSVVEGSTDADSYRVSVAEPYEILDTRQGSKDMSVVLQKGGNVVSVPTPQDLQQQMSLSPDQVRELSSLCRKIEKHFRGPQDIEWALDRKGKFVILQSRPLGMPETRSQPAIAPAPDLAALAQGIGTVVQQGAASGTVFVLKNDRDLDLVPKGAVLVSRRDSSQFVLLMTRASAIITETGTPTSHMAALCREFRIPTIVNAGAEARKLAQGQEITLLVDENGGTIYPGVVESIVQAGQLDATRMETLIEFRKKRYLLRYIAPLNLVDPLKDEFTPAMCATLHDVLRFIHEKSVAELVERAEYGVKSGALKLDLPIPAGLMVIDIGGGLKNGPDERQVTADRIASLPLKAVITGMTKPGIWRSDVVPLRANDFISSMLHTPDITTEAGRVEQNMAVVSAEYANISLKFGYHFIVMDCFCSDTPRFNHIYFRFAGGATDMRKRSRRVQLIAEILAEFGFNVKIKGDLLVARLANIPQQEALAVLDQLGRLFSYTRQLDAVLNDDQAVSRYSRSFLDGNYDVQEAGRSQNNRG